MSRRMKLGLFAGLLVVAVGAIVALGAAKGKNKAVEVRMEPVGARDLVAVVTASGKIEQDTKVDILSDIQGRITRIGVKEGDMVRKGDFLLQIDAAVYLAAVSRSEAPACRRHRLPLPWPCRTPAASPHVVRSVSYRSQARRQSPGSGNRRRSPGSECGG
mgnify:CR=1 FL=1